MISTVKQTLLRVLPAGLSAELMIAQRRYFPGARHKREHYFLGKAGDPSTVLQGPFKGMKYLPVAFFGPMVDKKLGVYELELAGASETVIAAVPDLVVDVGTAEGYYAVGFARRLPAARIVGYDISKVARALTRRLARLNGVEHRIELRGAATPEDLQTVLSTAKRPALLSDCEGFEDVLLDPVIAPALIRTLIIVEVHDMFNAGVSGRLRERFRQTHEITEMLPRPRRPEDAPPGTGFTTEEALEAMNEGRGHQAKWFLLTPRK